MLDHDEVSVRERKYRLAEVIVVKGEDVLSVEDRKGFFVDGSTGQENIDGHSILVVIALFHFIGSEAIGFERAVWANQKLLIDFHT